MFSCPKVGFKSLSFMLKWQLWLVYYIIISLVLFPNPDSVVFSLTGDPIRFLIDKKMSKPIGSHVFEIVLNRDFILFKNCIYDWNIQQFLAICCSIYFGLALIFHSIYSWRLLQVFYHSWYAAVQKIYIGKTSHTEILACKKSINTFKVDNISKHCQYGTNNPPWH